MINLKFTKSGIKIRDSEFNSNKSKAKIDVEKTHKPREVEFQFTLN